MALAQRFARVTPEYLERHRGTALDSPGAAPGWDPPVEDLLDTGWAVWGVIRHCHRAGVHPGTVALLDRAVSGDPETAPGFLDHPEVHDGFGDPPRVLAPGAVAAVARGPDAIDTGALLAGLPDSPDEAAAVCGFDPWGDGDVRAHLVEHCDAMRELYRGAARRGRCVAVRID